MNVTVDNNLKKLYQILLLVLAISLPLPEPILPIILIALTPLSIYLRINQKISVFSHKDTIWYFVLFVLVVVGLFWCIETKQGLKLVEKNVSYLILPIVIIPQLIKDSIQLYKGFVISLLIVAGFTLIATLTATAFFESESRWYFEEIERFGFHPTYMAVYSLLAIVFLSHFYIFKNKFLTYLTIAFFVLFLFFLASRIAIITLVCLLIFKLINTFEKKYLVGLTIVILTGASLFFISEDFNYKTKQLLDFKGVTYYDNNNYGSVSVRVAKIKASLIVWEENKWFGTGTGCLKPKLVKAYRSKELECWPCSRNEYNPHNQYLHYFAEYGIVGAVMFLGLLFFLIFNAIKKGNYILIEVLIVFLLAFLTESLLYRQKGITAFVFFTVLLYRLSNIKNKT